MIKQNLIKKSFDHDQTKYLSKVFVDHDQFFLDNNYFFDHFNFLKIDLGSDWLALLMLWSNLNQIPAIKMIDLNVKQIIKISKVIKCKNWNNPNDKK